MSEDNSRFTKIRSIVSRIPKGKVATYGQIANLAGINDARVVGWAMHGNKSPKVPCHRVVNRFGQVAKNYAFEGWEEQKARLEKEGVAFETEDAVDLEKFQWRPD